MDHAIGGASGATLQQRPQRPGWWWTLAVLVLVYLLSVAAVAIIVWPLSQLHVVPGDVSRPGGWPWPRSGAWATLAGVGPLLLVSVVFALLTRLVASILGGWNVRLWPIVGLCTLGATLPAGEAALTDSQGFWLLLVIVVRQWSITREPVARISRPAWLAIGVAGLLLALLTVSYQPLNPLTVVSTWDGSENGHEARSLPFTLSVDGAVGARILSVSVPRDLLVSYVVQLEDRHTLERRLPQGVELYGAIELSPTFCRRGSASVRPETLLVRLRVLGRERTQQLALDAGNNITCPRHR